MHVQHPHAEACSRATRCCDCVRNIVKFEIEKDSKSLPDKLLYKIGPGSREELLTDLDPAQTWIEPCCKIERSFLVAEIERDDDAGIARLAHAGRAFSSVRRGEYVSHDAHAGQCQ